MMTEVKPFTLVNNHNVELRYYGIGVFFSDIARQKLDSNKSLGRLIIFLGVVLVIISGIDSSSLSATITNSEQSIWPSFGKGIWIGFLVIAVGVFALIAAKEQSHSVFYILLPYAIVTLIFCLFGLLTSISVLQRYINDPYLSKPNNRSKEQTVQFALAGLLIGMFALSFLFVSCLSCIICWTIPNFCQKHQRLSPQAFHSSSQNIRHRSSRFSPRQNIPRYRFSQSATFNRAYQSE